MTEHRFCKDLFQLEGSHVIDPRGDFPWPVIATEKLPESVALGFAEPVDFPPIAQAVLAEDRIAIAVELDTPCGLEVARLVAAQFVAQGIARENIQIVCADQEGDPGDDFVVHDPSDSEQQAYLLVDREGVACYVNRLLFEADVVVPIGTGDGGRIRNSLCAGFCDQETKKYLDRMKPEHASAMERMYDDNLGVFWQVRIVTAPGDEILQVLVGASEAVLEKAGQIGTEAWALKIGSSADLVVASIESSCCQTWSHLRQAILNAAKVANEDAIIVLCTELRGKPSATWPMVDADHQDIDEDLADVFRGHHVYLASRLTQDSTEKFGFGYIDDSSQIQKLIDQKESCLLLRDAHRVGLKQLEAC